MKATHDSRAPRLGTPSAQEVFTDRVDEQALLAQFFSAIRQPGVLPAKPVLSFYGVGGVGKTTLMKRALLSLKANPLDPPLTLANCDLDNEEHRPDMGTMPFFAKTLRPALRRAGIPLPLFEAYFRVWWGKANPDTPYNEASLFGDVIKQGDRGMGIIDGISSAAEVAVGAALGFLTVGIRGADMAGASIRYFQKLSRADKLSNQLKLDLEQLELKSFSEHVAAVMACDLMIWFAHAPEKRALCLVLDGFERIQPDQASTKRTAEESLTDLIANLILDGAKPRFGALILGRETLRWAEHFDSGDPADPSWRDYIEGHLLGGLAEDDARDFLAKVADWYDHVDHTSEVEKQVASRIRQMSDDMIAAATEEVLADGSRAIHPFHLDLTVAQVAAHHHCPDDELRERLGCNPKELQTRFLRYMEANRLALHQALALALEFDQRVFDTLVDRQLVAGFARPDFHAFVDPLPTYLQPDAIRAGTWRFHRKMQDSLLENLKASGGGLARARDIALALAQSFHSAMETALQKIDWAGATRDYDRGHAILWAAMGLGAISPGEFVQNWGEQNLDVHFYTQARIRNLRSLLAQSEAELGPDHPDVATSLNNLAELYKATGRYDEAEPLYQRSFAILGKALDPEHPDVATSLNNLAGLLYATRRYGEAEPLLQRSLAIREKTLGPDHPAVATSLNNLAELYKATDRYGEAEPLFQRSLALMEKAPGPDHPGVAASLNNLAALYVATGRFDEAEPLFQRSLAIVEKTLGPEHPHVATNLNSLAGLFYATGRYGEAEPLFQRSLAIRERALGPEHLDVATNLNSLAELYKATDRYGEAEPLYQRSLAIMEKTLGPEHLGVAASLHNLAELYYATGGYGEAEPLFQRSLAIVEKTLGPDHAAVATSLNNLADLIYATGGYGEAEPLYQRSLAIREKALGPEHPAVATSLNNLAWLFKATNRYGEAEPLYQRSLAIREKTLGHEHPHVASSLNNLAGLYKSTGRYDEAEPLYQRSLAIRQKTLGSEHPDVAASINNLVDLYRATGRQAEADALLRRSQQIAS